ncbi:MAG: hypothetical protein WBD97_19690, partial [Pseudolabrys sp.]
FRQHRQQRHDQRDERSWSQHRACGRQQRHVQRQHRQYGLDFRRAKRHCDHERRRRVVSGTISNSGAITATSIAGDILVFNIANASGATFAGNIVNSGALTAAGSGTFTAAGLSITRVAGNSGTFLGSIVNAGVVAAKTGMSTVSTGGTN